MSIKHRATYMKYLLHGKDFDNLKKMAIDYYGIKDLKYCTWQDKKYMVEINGKLICFSKKQYQDYLTMNQIAKKEENPIHLEQVE